MHASEMLIEVFLTREAFSSVALAIGMGAVELLSRTTVFVMDFSFVSQETARVCKSRELLAAVGRALVGSVVLVHMFTVQTRSAFGMKNK
jgi:hypothetical protein